MLINFLQKNTFLRNIIYKIARERAINMFHRIEKFLDKNDYILDVGSGTCNVYEVLLQKGYKIVSLDIQDLSFVDNLKPILYEGGVCHLMMMNLTSH